MAEPRERPIIFSGPMVRALIEGRKTQTRRVVRYQFLIGEPFEHAEEVAGAIPCPYGSSGDRLWVRETWQQLDSLAPDETDVWLDRPRAGLGRLNYRADLVSASVDDGPWRSPIHMPRWASRITLELTEVRVQRLQAISEEDALAEGVVQVMYRIGTEPPIQPARQAFAGLWDSINGERSGSAWADDPWVWALSFRVVAP